MPNKEALPTGAPERPIRVLYATHASNLTGASRSLLDLLSGLDRDQVEPSVLLRQHGPLEAKLDELAVPYEVIPHVGCIRSKTPLKPNWVKKSINTLAASRVVWLLRRNRIDLVHSNSLLADVGMRAANQAVLPYVAHIREHGLEDHGLVFLDMNSMARLVASADRVIAISDSVRDHFEPWGDSERFVTLHDGLDVSSYLLERGEILRGTGVHMLMAGRIAPGKGQLDAVRAAELLASRGVRCSLTVVGGIGDETYNAQLHSYVQEHGLSGVVEIKPFSDDLSAEYRRTDIALMCSTHEALGRATVEGMLAGCLVIGADAGATPEIVTHGETGLLYEVSDPESLTAQVVWALGHQDEARAIAVRGQSYAAGAFDNKAYAEKVVKLYREILEELYSVAERQST